MNEKPITTDIDQYINAIRTYLIKDIKEVPDQKAVEAALCLVATTVTSFASIALSLEQIRRYIDRIEQNTRGFYPR
jgi:hypothetical protein